MSDNEEWSEWHLHDGKGCPCLGQWVFVEYIEGGHDEGIAGSLGGQSWDWEESARCGFWRVARYCIRKPRGLVILQQIAQGIKQPEDA